MRKINFFLFVASALFLSSCATTNKAIVANPNQTTNSHGLYERGLNIAQEEPSTISPVVHVTKKKPETPTVVSSKNDNSRGLKSRVGNKPPKPQKSNRRYN